MDSGYSGIKLLVFLIFILLEACFYGFGAAIQNVNESELEEEMEKGSKAAREFLRIVNRPTRFVNAIQVLTNLAAMAAGAYLLGGWIRIPSVNPAILRGLEGIISVIFIVSFGIVIPKRCAAKNPKAWGYRVMKIVLAAAIILRPMVWAVTGICWAVLKIFGVDMASDQENVTEEDIMSMVNEGHEQGILEASEAEMITNIFELDDKKAEEIMTHRKNVVALDGSMKLQEAVNFILTEGNNSRFPVYAEDIDDVVGILHMRDALVYALREDYKEKKLTELPGLLREAHFIPESRNINTLFKEMQSQKIHMEIVVDEYGQTSGIVTMEDILEEIVGNILDEYDEEEDFIRPLNDGSYIIKGMASLEEVGEILGIEFQSEDEEEEYDTVNGFLISKLDRIPKDDEKPEVLFKGYRFKVLKVENKMIGVVKVIKEAQ